MNRWAWLPHDPQAAALPEFDMGVSSRIVNKDNHRPAIPTPLPGSSGQPEAFYTPIDRAEQMGCARELQFRMRNPAYDKYLRKIEVVRRMPK